MSQPENTSAATATRFNGLPQSVRDRIGEAIAARAGSSVYEEWLAVMEWEDRMLAFANEAAGKSDALANKLNGLAKSLRVMRSNLAESVRPDERAFWEGQFDKLIEEVESDA